MMVFRKLFPASQALSTPTKDFLYIVNGLWLLLLVASIKYAMSASMQTYVLMLLGGVLGMSHAIAPLYLFLNKRYQKQLTFEAISTGNKFLILWAGFTLVFYVSALSGQVHWGEVVGEAFIFMSLIHIIWNYFHFGKQHFGILHLYNLKSSNIPKTRTLFENYFCLVSTTLSLLNVSYYLTPAYNGIFRKYEMAVRLNMDWVPLFMPVALLALGLATLYVIGYSWRNSFKSIYVLIVFLQPVVGFYIFQHYHFFFFGVSHWLAELFLISKLMAEPSQESPQKGSRALKTSILGVMVLGSLMSLLFYWAGSAHGNLRFHTVPIPDQVTNSVTMFSLNLFYFGVFFWLNTTHFFMDKIVYSSGSYRDKTFLKQRLLGP